MTDNEIIYWAITHWQNYIQTGDICLSPQDCKNQKKEGKIKVLGVEQMETILQMEKLKNKYS